MLRVGALMNWGVGLHAFETIHNMADVAIEFLVTHPPSGSGDPWEGAVQEFAENAGYRCLDESQLSFDELQALAAESEIDLIICHSYPRILPKSVFNEPRLGCLNIHCSLLPKYRGPSPHYWILKNKETLTGITFHLLDEGIDSGPIVHQEMCDIKPEDGMDALLERLKNLVETSLPEAIEKLIVPDFRSFPQDQELATYAPRPSIN